MAFRRRNGKYNARKVKTEDGSFMSKKELKRWTELKLQEEAGVISDLRKQVKFVLIPAQREPDHMDYSKSSRGRLVAGKLLEREVSYIADFVYIKDGKQIVEDAKGLRKGNAYDLFVVKRKMMLYFHRIKVQEV